MYSWWNPIHCPSINETETFCFSPWRYADLECIHSQLQSSKVKKMEMLLEAVESSYSPAFSNILQDVLAGNDTSYTSDNRAKRNEACFLRCSTCLIEGLKRDLRWFIIIHFCTCGTEFTKLTLIKSWLTSFGGGKGHLHLLEAAAAPVWGHGDCRVFWCQGSDWPFDAHSVPGVGQLQILQLPSTPHRSAAGDLQSPHTAGQVQFLLWFK